MNSIVIRIVILATVALGFLSCRTTGQNATLKESQVQLNWNEKSEIYDFSKICPLKKLQWKEGNDPVQYLSEVIEGSTLFQKTIAGDDSGVVVSQKGASRQFFEKYFPSCGPKEGGIYLRYSIDRIPGNEYAYEMFVKDLDTNEVIGLAFNSKGKELTTVPTELAFDKDGNKSQELAKQVGHSDFQDDKIVRSRLGCFSCHPSVSSDYDIDGQESFWKDAVLVEFLQKEKDHQEQERIAAAEKKRVDGLASKLFEALQKTKIPPVTPVRRQPAPTKETILDTGGYISGSSVQSFSFTAKKSGYYRIETYEDSPSITMLLKLKKGYSAIAENHHGGARLLNARIDKHLSTGSYTIEASHFLKLKGTFKLRVIYSSNGF